MFDYKQFSDECIKCGKCKINCTIYNINEDEATSPRGFIHLLGAYEDKRLELDKNAKDIFESCFLCYSCTEVCPVKIPTDLMIEQVRNDIAKKYKITWYKRLFFYLLRHRKLTDLLARLGFVFKTCAFKADEQNNTMIPRFSLPIIKKNRLLPSLKLKTFLNKYPQTIEFGNKRKVAIFIGCLANYSYTEIGDSLLFILKRLQIDAFIPKKQLCCGAPAYFTGDFKTVDYLIKYNIEYFESFIDEVEAMIVPEATCSSMIINDWAHYLHDQPKWLRRAKKITKKVFIATKWLHDQTNLKELLEKNGKNFDDIITYHDPCHARKTQNIYKEPRELLKNFHLKEMQDPNKCCGFGGVTIQSEKYHLAQKAGVQKALMIEKTQAKYVSAECSACRMQISNALYQQNSKIIFKNPLELIVKALG